MMSKKALDATRDAGGGAVAAAAGGGGAAAAADAAASGDGSCPVCGVKFCAGDVIPILPNEGEREIRRR